MTYTQHLIKNWKVAFHALHDFFAHFIHGLIPVIKIRYHQPDIIRCKDCAYCDSDVVDVPYGMTKKVWWCDRLYAGANENLIVEPDNFCSWAERREDEAD